MYLGVIALEKDKDEEKAHEYVEKGIRLLEEAVKNNSSNHKTHQYLGIAYSILKRPDDSIASLKEAIRIKPDYADAHNNL